MKEQDSFNTAKLWQGFRRAIHSCKQSLYNVYYLVGS